VRIDLRTFLVRRYRASLPGSRAILRPAVLASDDGWTARIRGVNRSSRTLLRWRPRAVSAGS